MSELLKNCFVETDTALKILKWKIFVRRMGSAIGQRESHQQRFNAKDAAELRDDGYAAAFAYERGLSIKSLAQGALGRFA